MLSIGDQVIYTGRKYPDLGKSRGTIEARVQGSPGLMVVSYGNDSYLLHEDNLRKPRPSKSEDVEQVLASIVTE